MTLQGQCEFQIREAQGNDLAYVAAVYNAARPIELIRSGVSLEANTVAREDDIAVDFGRGCRFLVAVSAEGQVVGIAGFTRRELTMLYVLPSWHRRGIGRALLFSVLRRTNHPIETTLMVGNEAAEKLYEMAGFTPLSEFESTIGFTTVRYRKLVRPSGKC